MSQWFYDEPSGIQASWDNGLVIIELDEDDAYELMLSLQQLENKTRITNGTARALKGVLE